MAACVLLVAAAHGVAQHELLAQRLRGAVDLALGAQEPVAAAVRRPLVHPLVPPVARAVDVGPTY